LIRQIPAQKKPPLDAYNLAGLLLKTATAMPCTAILDITGGTAVCEGPYRRWRKTLPPRRKPSVPSRTFRWKASDSSRCAGNTIYFRSRSISATNASTVDEQLEVRPSCQIRQAGKPPITHKYREGQHQSGAPARVLIPRRCDSLQTSRCDVTAHGCSHKYRSQIPASSSKVGD